MEHLCSNDYQIIIAVLWKRINDTGKNWRHVYKVLYIFLLLFYFNSSLWSCFTLGGGYTYHFVLKKLFWGCYPVLGINLIMISVCKNSSDKLKWELLCPLCCFVLIVDSIWLQALAVLEYLVVHGSERVTVEIREHAHQISVISVILL